MAHNFFVIINKNDVVLFVYEKFCKLNAGKTSAYYYYPHLVLVFFRKDFCLFA